MNANPQSCYPKSSGTKSSSKRPTWCKIRRYKHFDLPLGFAAAEKLATDPLAVARHAFYPLLAYDIKSARFRKHRRQKPKTRPIRMAAHADSHIYAYYASLLSRAYEAYLKDKPFSESVIAYRRRLGCNIDFANDAIREIQHRSSCTAIALDLKGFFDSIDHENLKLMWCKILGIKRLPPDHFAVFKSITQYTMVDMEQCYKLLGYVDKKGKALRRAPDTVDRLCSPEDYRTKIRGAGLVKVNPTAFWKQPLLKNPYGIPQGTPISAVLSNIFMLKFDEVMHNYATQHNGYYRRYCDDVLLIVPTTENSKHIEACGFLLSQLGDAVKINDDKTVISIFRGGKLSNEAGSKIFQYLGFTYDGINIRFRGSTIAKYYARMINGIRVIKKIAKRSPNYKGVKSLHMREILRKHSHLGRRNFFSYARRSAEVMGQDKPLKKQLNKHMPRILKEIEK